MAAERLYEFGEFRLDPAERLLFCSNKHVPLPPKAIDVLVLLVERRGHLVDKDTLLKELWPDTFVEEGNLTQNISVLRRILTEGRDGKELIETIPKRGYRFIAEVREVPASPTASALARSWRRHFLWAAPLGLALLSVTAYFAWHHYYSPRSTLASRRIMLAVLPVENLSGDPAREYVSDGLTEEIIAQLGSLNPQRLGVIARTSSMAYKKTNKTVDKIGRELSVDYVLETSVRESTGTIRFTAQLIQTRDQTHIWAHSYERPRKDMLSLQGELARTIAEEIRISLTPQQKARLSAQRPVNPDAYDAFVRGRYHWNERSPREVRSAIGYFEQAVAKEPEFAPAYAGLADSYTLLTMMRDAAPSEMMPRAKDALLKALAIDDSMADAHTTLGEVLEVFDWNWPGAEKEYRKAIELDPNDANAHHQYAIHLAVMGRFGEALEETQRAQRLDPVSPVMFTSSGWILLRSRLPDRAITECQKALDLDPKFARGHLCLGEAYEEMHDLKRAAEEFLAGKTLAGITPEAEAELRKAIQDSGYEGYFRLRLTQLAEKSKKSYVSPYDFADFSLRLGNKEEALKWLEAAYAERSPYLVFLRIEPRMDALRSDVRFAMLLQRVGFPP